MSTTSSFEDPTTVSNSGIRRRRRQQQEQEHIHETTTTTITTTNANTKTILQPPTPRTRKQVIDSYYTIIANSHYMAQSITELSNGPRLSPELRPAMYGIYERIQRQPVADISWVQWMKIDREIGMLMRMSMVAHEELEGRVRACL